MRSTSPLAIALAASLSACGGNSAGGDAGADGTALIDANVTPDALDIDAAPPECGNGAEEEGEVCDDGNLVNGDGCNETCTLIDGWDLVAHDYVSGDQREPAVACNPERVVIAYTDWSGSDGSGAGVKVRLFGRDGMPTISFTGDNLEFRANSTLFGHQTLPRVALRPEGPFFVVWQDESDAGGAAPDVRGRLFGAHGEPLTQDFLLSVNTTNLQGTPDVATTPEGIALAVWVDASPGGLDTVGFGVRGRLFEADGSPRVNAQTATDSEFQINQTYAGDQIQPAVVWLGSHFLVVWADNSATYDASGYGIVGILLDEDGAPVGAGTEIALNTTIAGNQAGPRVAIQQGVGALVVWNDDSHVADTDFHGIRGRLIASDGTPRNNTVSGTNGDFQINTTYPAGQQLPAASATADGMTMVVWHDWSAEDGSGAGIRARLLGLGGGPVAHPDSPTGADYLINTTWLEPQITPVVCAAGDSFVALWEDQSESAPDESGSAIRYRLLSGLVD